MDIKARLRRPLVAGFTHTIDAERAEAANVIEQLEGVIAVMRDAMLEMVGQAALRDENNNGKEL